MALSEGTCICLAIGMICLSFVLRNILKLQSERISETKALAAKQNLAVAPPQPTGPPPVDAETQRAALEAQLEALHRDEWCRKFEEEEIKEHARQRMFQYTIQKRAMMLENAKNYLNELRRRRMALQRQLFLEDQYALNAPRWNTSPYIEVLDDGSDTSDTSYY
jgi:hypothetical protein